MTLPTHYKVASFHYDGRKLVKCAIVDHKHDTLNEAVKHALALNKQAPAFILKVESEKTQFNMTWLSCLGTKLTREAMKKTLTLAYNLKRNAIIRTGEGPQL